MSESIVYLGGKFEFRKPTVGEWDEWRRQYDDSIGGANRQLLMTSMTVGTFEDLHDRFERKPAAVALLVEELKKISGADWPCAQVGDEETGLFVVSKTRAGEELRFTCPTLVQFEAYLEAFRKAGRPALRYLAAMTLDESVPKSRLEAHFEDAPLSAENIGEALAQIAAGDLEVTVKKG